MSSVTATKFLPLISERNFLVRPPSSTIHTDTDIALLQSAADF